MLFWNILRLKWKKSHIATSIFNRYRSISAGKHKIVFLVRGPIILVAVSQGSESQTQVGFINVIYYVVVVKTIYVYAILLLMFLMCQEDSFDL